MASSYDAELFERSQRSFVLSQRVKHILGKLSGPLRLAIQMLSTNGLLRILPRPLAFGLLFCYIFFIVLLFFLIVSNLRDKRKHYEDHCLYDAMNYRKRIVSNIGNAGVIFILFYVSAVSGLIAVWRENLNEEKGLLFAIMTFLLLHLLAHS